MKDEILSRLNELEQMIFGNYEETGYDTLYSYLEHDNPLPCKSDTCLKCKTEKYYDTYLKKE